MNSEHAKCLLCDSEMLKPLPKYQEDYLVECGNCSFIFSRRIPTSEELTDHYNTYPRGSGISPITIKRYNELLDQLEKYRTTNNILDIGCGDGYFLLEAKKRNWNVFGTEFTDNAVEICRSKEIAIHQGILDPANYKGSLFDVITSFEVIEHINNPRQEIRNISSLLREGGVFYFTTPNFNSMSRIILGTSWNVIEYPEHLSYYTPGTINYLLSQFGFKKIFLTTTGISTKALINAKQDNDPASSEEKLRNKTEHRLIYRLLKHQANFLLNLSRKGDNIKGLYRK